MKRINYLLDTIGDIVCGYYSCRECPWSWSANHVSENVCSSSWLFRYYFHMYSNILGTYFTCLCVIFFDTVLTACITGVILFLMKDYIGMLFIDDK